MSSNRNYLADFCLAQQAIVGYDSSRGFVMTEKGKHYSEIEDWRFANEDDVAKDPTLKLGESVVYTNPMIRQYFFTPAARKEYLERAKANIDPGCSLVAMDIYNTTGPNPPDAVNQLTLPDPLDRTAEYLFVPSSGEKIPLNRLRALASTGQDRNGVQIYNDEEYLIEVDGPGVFTYVPPPDGSPEGAEGALTFLPPKR